MLNNLQCLINGGLNSREVGKFPEKSYKGGGPNKRGRGKLRN